MNPISDWLSNVSGPFDGYKAYLGAAGFLLLAGYSLVTRQPEAAVQYFSLALGVAGIRHAQDKAAPADPEPLPLSPPAKAA